MTAYSIIAALNLLEQQHGLLFYLIDLSLKSTILIALGFLLQLLIRDRNPALRSIAWMMAFAGLLLLPLFHEIVPAISLSYYYQSALLSYAGGALDAAAFATQVDALASSLLGIALSYLLVCALLTVYLFSGIVKVVLLSRSAKPFRHEIANSCLQRLQQSNGCDRAVELLVSPRVSSPLTWGLWRHKILFPLAAHGWSEELLQQTISHELAHVQRGDWILQVFARIAVGLYWINPLVWVAHRQLQIETEKACDEVAVENCGSPLSYAENLLQLANGFGVQRALAAPALLGVRSSLSQRIRHILKQEVNRYSSDTSHILPSLLFAALLVAPFSALGIQLKLIDPPRVMSYEQPVIAVSFFPNGSKEHVSLMAEFR